MRRQMQSSRSASVPTINDDHIQEAEQNKANIAYTVYSRMYMYCTCLYMKNHIE